MNVLLQGGPRDGDRVDWEEVGNPRWIPMPGDQAHVTVAGSEGWYEGRLPKLVWCEPPAPCDVCGYLHCECDED